MRICCRFAVLFATVCVTNLVHAEERHALVIGNSKYRGEAALRNPANDANALEATLKKLDFKVTKKIDLDRKEFEKAVVEFGKTLKKGSVAVFFYAGHGLQVKGENYLVPIKTELSAEFEVKEKCYKVDQVLSAMEESRAALKIVVLDCCRDNPFTRSWTRSATGGKGLAAIGAIPNGTVIAFSTAPGQTASDGRDANSPYTTHLVASLSSRPTEGLELKEALFEASRAVKKETGQVPWMNLEASLEKYYLWRAPIEVNSAGQASAEKPVGKPTAVKKGIHSDYLPLTVGNRWEYEGVYSTDYVHTVKASDENGAVVESNFRGKDGKTGIALTGYLVREDGIYTTSHEGYVVNPPRKLLALRNATPEPAGTSWKNEPDAAKQGSNETIMVSTSEKIKVPAGEFTAVKVKRKYTNANRERRNEIFWFVPKIGIVQFEVTTNTGHAISRKSLKTFKEGP